MRSSICWIVAAGMAASGCGVLDPGVADPESSDTPATTEGEDEGSFSFTGAQWPVRDGYALVPVLMKRMGTEFRSIVATAAQGWTNPPPGEWDHLDLPYVTITGAYTCSDVNPDYQPGSIVACGSRFGTASPYCWLGKAIWHVDANGFITQAMALFNYSFLLDHPLYWSATTKAHVACHELGHVIGLGHSSSSTSCMNDDVLSATAPNSSDWDDLHTLYQGTAGRLDVPGDLREEISAVPDGRGGFVMTSLLAPPACNSGN